MEQENRLRDIAQKHGFNPGAVKFMAQAIQKAGGRFAQWQHPGLGGFGQWLPGMTTLSPREPGLEIRLNALCQDLMTLVQETARAGRDGNSPGKEDPVWWPKTLGLQPDLTGAQGGVRYAYFADSRRLAVEDGEDARVTVYDTADHQVHAVRQVPGAKGNRLVLQCQRGETDLAALTVVEPPGD